MARFHIIPFNEAPDLAATALADPRFARIEDHPFTNSFARRYYPAAIKSCRDLSFLITENEKVIALVLATASSRRLDYYGQPARVIAASDIESSSAAAAEAIAVETLHSLMVAADCDGLVIEDISAPRVTSIGEAAMKFGGKPGLRLHAMADVSGGEETLRRGLRKSFRSLINWGKRELALSFVNKERPEKSDFDAFRSFHHKVAGRVTRTEDSWSIMFDSIASGGGELVLARLKDELVAGTMFLDGNRISYYASGVYDREQFDKPMAHWPLWAGLLRVPDRGCAMVDLGHLPFEGEASEKEVNIGYFKRGFATDIESKLVWKWQSPHAEETAKTESSYRLVPRKAVV